MALQVKALATKPDGLRARTPGLLPAVPPPSLHLHKSAIPRPHDINLFKKKKLNKTHRKIFFKSYLRHGRAT